MSAAIAVLPLIVPILQAAAEPALNLTLAECAASAGTLAAVAAGLRKGPHALRLVQASGRAPAAAPDVAGSVDRTVAKTAAMPVPVILPRRSAPELAFYRKYTEGMLRRYTRLSMESGRAPSLLGRELFRGNVTSYKVHSFDDVVIYVHDVEQCLKRLGKGQQVLIERIAVQQYTQAETAAMYGIALRTVVRRYAEALDQLTRLLLERGLLCRQEMGG